MTASLSQASDNPQQQELLRVCRIGRAQGLKGEVNVQVFTDDPHARFSPTTVLYTQDGQEFIVESSRQFKQRWIVHFTHITDRTAAEQLQGTLLYIPREDYDEDEDDGFYLDDLVDLRVVLQDSKKEVGKVSQVLDSPAHDLLEICEPSGVLSLVPFVEQIVTDVDLDAGVITIDPPHGLLHDID